MAFDAVSTDGRVAEAIDGPEALADSVPDGSDVLPADAASSGGGEPWLGVVRAKVPITWHDIVVPAFVFLMARLAVLVTARAVTWARPETSVEQLLSSWDGGWYLSIAEDGYPDSLDPELSGGNRWAFYPAFPWLIRAFHELTGFSYTTSGIAVSIIVGTAAAIAIWSLVIEHFGRETALFTVALVCFFPTAYVLGMVYTESLFLLSAAVCLRAVGHRQWILAGLVASGAYLIRQHGAVLVGVVMVCGLWAVYRERRFRPLWAVVLAPIGAAAWSWYQWVETGTPRASLEAQRLWDQTFVWFQTPFRSLWRVTTDRDAWSVAPDVMAAGALAFVALSVVLAARFIWRNPNVVPVEWLLYSGGMILVSFSPSWATSILRYQMGLFPLFAIAWHTAPKWLTATMVACGGVLMGTLAFSAFLGVLEWQTAPFAP